MIMICVDATMVEGASTLPYSIANPRSTFTPSVGIPRCGGARGLHPHELVAETFLDEVAKSGRPSLRAAPSC
jgi:hypothetical protein